MSAIVFKVNPDTYNFGDIPGVKFDPELNFTRRDFYRWMYDDIPLYGDRWFILDLFVEIKGNGVSTVEELIINALLEYANNNPNAIGERTIEDYIVNSKTIYLQIKNDIEALTNYEQLADTYTNNHPELDPDGLTNAIVVDFYADDCWVAFYYEPLDNKYDPESPDTVTTERPTFNAFIDLGYLIGGYAGTTVFTDSLNGGYYNSEDLGSGIDGGEASSDYITQ